jgi:formate dehydrogenase maturation protein FdhE
MNIARETCPKCESDSIVAEFLNCDETEAWRTIACMDCDFMWNEIFTFSHNEDIVTCAKLDF